MKKIIDVLIMILLLAVVLAPFLVDLYCTVVLDSPYGFIGCAAL